MKHQNTLNNPPQEPYNKTEDTKFLSDLRKFCHKIIKVPLNIPKLLLKVPKSHLTSPKYSYENSTRSPKPFKFPPKTKKWGDFSNSQKTNILPYIGRFNYINIEEGQRVQYLQGMSAHIDITKITSSCPSFFPFFCMQHNFFLCN